MTPTQHIDWIDEPESVFMVDRKKLQTIESPVAPASLYRLVVCVPEPSYPQKLHPICGVVQYSRSSVYHVDMIDAQNVCIDILVTGRIGIFSGEYHDVPMICIRVDDILGMTHVICGVIDLQDVVLVRTLLFEEEFVEFLGSHLR